jgi:lysine 6-dehydrogenase
MRIVVLGGGRVGAAMVRDLAADERLEVVLVDASERALEAFADEGRVQTRRADLSDGAALGQAIADADLVLGAVPGSMGFRTLQRVLEAGKNAVDISFFAEDAFELDGLAREKGLTAIVDCGVAPGCSNLILGHLESEMESVDSFSACVGGLPRDRAWPFEYKAPFSPSDVIEEYVRPARLRQNGKLVVRPALSDPEMIDFAGIGTLEAFVTDGLRSLLATSMATSMVEKTLRYPGHREKMEMLRCAGFFSDEPIELRDGTLVKPLDVTSRLLFPMWQLLDGEDELTVMRVEVVGRRDGQCYRFVYDLLDRYDPVTRTSSMARTTGYTATSAVRLFVDGLYREPGISPPEFLGRHPGCYDRMMADLAARGITYRETIELLPG